MKLFIGAGLVAALRHELCFRSSVPELGEPAGIGRPRSTLACTRAQADRRAKGHVPVVAVLVTLLVGASRVYLGVQWPNDVPAKVAIVATGFVAASTLPAWPDLIVGLAIEAMNADAAREVWEAAGRSTGRRRCDAQLSPYRAGTGQYLRLSLKSGLGAAGFGRFAKPLYGN